MEAAMQSPERRACDRWLGWGALVIVVLLGAAVRWRLVDVPLERDEGVYAYAGQLLLRGTRPYEQVYDMRLPGIYAAYAAVLALFGETHRGIHLGLLVINAATSIAVFLLGRRLIDDVAGVVAAAMFAVLSLTPSVHGMFANAEHFVILPAVVGLVLLLRAIDTDRVWPLVVSGVALGLGVVIKQHGAAFVALGGLYLLITLSRQTPREPHRIVSRLATFAFSATLPYVVACGVLWSIGVFDRFWFWTVSYAPGYVDQMPLAIAWAQFVRPATAIVDATPWIWCLVGLGLVTVWWIPTGRPHRLFAVLLALFSLLATVPGFFFRPHYFILTLPAAALLAGVAISAVVVALGVAGRRALGYGLGLGLAVICLGASVARQRDVLFRQTPTEIARSVYQLNPFPESLEIAEIVEATTSAEDRIAILGSEPQILFYSGRRSATGYVYVYPLMERHDLALRMQEEMIREIEAAEPALLIFVNLSTSWLRRPDSHGRIFEWFAQYRQRFDLVAVADLQPGGTRYYQGATLAQLDRRPQLSVEIYRRRG